MFGGGHMRFHNPDGRDRGRREISHSPPVPHHRDHMHDDDDYNAAAAAEHRSYSRSPSAASRGGGGALGTGTGLIDSPTTNTIITATSSSSSSEGPAGLIDLVRTLGGRSWSKTDKRGRQITNTAIIARSRNTTTCSASQGGGGGGGGGGGDESLLLMSHEDRFKCSTCNKSFQTHQALGGHMSSHNKLMMKQKKQNRQIITMPKHVCNICNKSFPTGQALGGHKRRHWTPPAVVIDQPSSNNYNYNNSAASSSTAWPPTCSAPTHQLQLGLALGGSSSSLIINNEVEAAGSGSKVLDFDLNEPPPDFGEDEGMESY